LQHKASQLIRTHPRPLELANAGFGEGFICRRRRRSVMTLAEICHSDNACKWRQADRRRAVCPHCFNAITRPLTHRGSADLRPQLADVILKAY